MIQTEQNVSIAVPIAQVWDYVSDITRWAALMPGQQSCLAIDADNSRWVLKVGVGGMVRVVTVLVHVVSWNGPGHVTFRFELEGDPVKGGGTYDAVAKGPAETEVCLKVQVEGSGPLAPMWEAMGRPVLSQLAKSFACQLRDAIEIHSGSIPSATPQTAEGWLSRLLAYFRNLFGK